jgi:type IV secretory pathway TrbF-like protein
MLTKIQTPDVCPEAALEEPDTRTARAKRHFEEIWSNAIAAKQNWQRIAFCEAFIVLCAVFWIGYLGQLPKQVLYVVERDKAGDVAYAGPVKPADMDAKTWDLVRIQALKKLLESWRTVTSDRTAQANDWDRAFLFVGDGSQAKATLSAWFEQNDPFKRADRGELVSVHFKTFDVEGGRTYGLWWDEVTTSLAGQVTAQKSYRARVVYEMHIPSAQKAREENPLGVLVTELSVQEVQ